MNHKRNVNYWSNSSGGFIWICQGACPKVQLREDDLPQVLCSPPCSLDQESQTPFVAQCVCDVYLVCSHFPLKLPRKRLLLHAVENKLCIIGT